MIKLRHAYKVYSGNVCALNNINLEISKGEFVFLIGPSGSGKTTLFKLLSAYDKPTSGSVEVMRFDVSQIKDKEVPFLRRQIGVVYQDYKLIKNKTIFDNIRLPLEIRREKESYINDRSRELLDSVGLYHKKNSYPEQLSGGEQQRVSIARALVHRPSLLIADEPTGNLDPELGLEIIDLLERVNAQGTTVFVATHNHELIKSRPKRVIEIRNGDLVRQA